MQVAQCCCLKADELEVVLVCHLRGISSFLLIPW